jgi:glycine/D-amino acid oxidase-like deaminating enzyme
MNAHVALQEELGGDWLQRVGNLAWEEEPGAIAGLRRTVDRLRDWSYAVENLTRKEALALEPDLAIAPDVEEIAFTPEEGYVRVAPFVAALVEAARRLGATLLSGRVTAILRAGDRVRGIQTADGTRVEGDVVIDCAGPAAGEIARLAGVEIPVGREPGRLLYTAPVATSLRRVVHAAGVHFRPDGAGLVLAVQARDGVVEDARSGEVRPAWAPEDSVARAARHLPRLAGATLDSVRIGVRPMPGDRLPIVGFLPGVDRFYVVVSHSGVTLSPLWGRVAAAEVLGGRPDARLAPFRPGRFSNPGA